MTPLRRFALTIQGAGTHIEKEALYYGASSFNGAPLSGANSYEIVFPQGQLPPVSAFWSLILCNSSFQLSANPINRYEVASHTPGLIFRSDGSLVHHGEQHSAGRSDNQLAAGSDRGLLPDPPYLHPAGADSRPNVAAASTPARLGLA